MLRLVAVWALFQTALANFAQTKPKVHIDDLVSMGGLVGELATVFSH